MKPWEEKWRVRNSPGCHDDIWSEGVGYVMYSDVSVGEPDYDEAAARVQLASAAPEMARLLLTRVDNSDSGMDDVDWYCFGCGHGGRHNMTCPIIAALRKAGVLGPSESESEP